LADVGFVVIQKNYDGIDAASVIRAVLGFGEMERAFACGILTIPHVRKDSFGIRQRLWSNPALEAVTLRVGGNLRTCTDENSPIYE